MLRRMNGTFSDGVPPPSRRAGLLPRVRRSLRSSSSVSPVIIVFSLLLERRLAAIKTIVMLEKTATCDKLNL